MSLTAQQRRCRVFFAWCAPMSLVRQPLTEPPDPPERALRRCRQAGCRGRDQWVSAHLALGKKQIRLTAEPLL